jgi:cytochrome c peroxidase
MERRTSTLVAARWVLTVGLLLCVSVWHHAPAQEAGQKGSSYMPVDLKEDFAALMARMKAAKPEVMKRQMDLLTARYDLSNRPAQGVTMTRGKAIQEGVRVKLPPGMTWEKLSATSPDEIRDKDLFPQGFLPLPHPNHAEGGMVFPTFHIDEN